MKHKLFTLLVASSTVVCVYASDTITSDAADAHATTPAKVVVKNDTNQYLSVVNGNGDTCQLVQDGVYTIPPYGETNLYRDANFPNNTDSCSLSLTIWAGSNYPDPSPKVNVSAKFDGNVFQYEWSKYIASNNQAAVEFLSNYNEVPFLSIDYLGVR